MSRRRKARTGLTEKQKDKLEGFCMGMLALGLLATTPYVWGPREQRAQQPIDVAAYCAQPHMVGGLDAAICAAI